MSVQVRRLTWLGTRTGKYRETTEFFGRVLGLGVVAEEPGLRDVPGFEAVTDYGWLTFRGPDGNIYNCTQGSRAVPEPPGEWAVGSPRPSVDEALAAVDAFDAALRARDLIAAEAVWALNRADVSILGSASGEEFIGPDAVRACLAALTSRPTAHGWRWVDRQVSVVGDVAWVLADASWQTVHADGAVTERPSRVTGVLVRADGTWRWCQYHGSEPLGSTG